MSNKKCSNRCSFQQWSPVALSWCLVSFCPPGGNINRSTSLLTVICHLGDGSRNISDLFAWNSCLFHSTQLTPWSLRWSLAHMLPLWICLVMMVAGSSTNRIRPWRHGDNTNTMHMRRNLLRSITSLSNVYIFSISLVSSAGLSLLADSLYCWTDSRYLMMNHCTHFHLESWCFTGHEPAGWWDNIRIIFSSPGLRAVVWLGWLLRSSQPDPIPISPQCGGWCYWLPIIRKTFMINIQLGIFIPLHT